MIADGYSPVPKGKIASIVTVLEMQERAPPRPEPAAVPWRLRPVPHPEPEWYRGLFREVGGPWLWFSRLRLTDEELAAVIGDFAVEIYAVHQRGDDSGLLELDFRAAGTCELAFFGLTPPLLGHGIGRWLMNRALERAWARPIDRFWTHTCTLDHPDALAFYIRTGFKPIRREVEMADDPRREGLLPRTCAPQVPLI
jgi:GNAT superfamily N-acetyltransferase